MRRAAIELAGALLLCCLLRGEAQQNKPELSSPRPTSSLDLRRMGYSGLSRVARLSGAANISLDFLDRRHLLVTFNPRKLFSRLPDCPPTHADRLVHAVVLEMPTGRFVKEADWYLHDSRRYIWTLGSGRFLLRRLNKLYEVDSDLEEKLVLDSPKELVWVSVTPNGGQIIAEALEKAASTSDETKDKGRARISFLETNSLDVQRVIGSGTAIHMEGTSAGFSDVRGSGNMWLVRFGAAARDRINITRVKSRKAPTVLYSSTTTMVVGRCAISGDRYNVSAFTVGGKFLWRQRRDRCRYSPVVRRSEEGSRFAVGTMIARANQGMHPSDGQDDPEAEGDGLEQSVEVFDTASGRSLLSMPATPPVLDGENFALSPDGQQLAILADSTVAFYSLPEASNEEQAKYAALEADLDLQLPPRKAPAGPAEAIEISAIDEETGADQASVAKPAETKHEASPVEGSGAAPPSLTATEPPVITLRTGTQVVALDVVVTDSKGQLIRGLQQDDFALSEDGKAQALRYFREYADTLPSDQGAEPAIDKPPVFPPNIFSNFAQPAESASTTVVLLDLLNTPLVDQARAQAELVKFLKTRPKNVSFALFTLSSRLQMIQGFTQDGDILMAAAAGKKGSTRYRPLTDSDTVVQPSLEAASTTARFLPQFNFFVESFQLQQAEVRLLDGDRRMNVTVGAFAQLARYLSGIPGRKNLVWLSGSFPLGLYPDTTGQSPVIQARNYSDDLRKAANLLAEAHVAVYPVNVQGLVTDPLFTAASNDTLSPISIQGSTPTGPARDGVVPFEASRRSYTAVPIAVMQDQSEQFALAQNSERATMDLLAIQTGGQPFYRTNGIAQAIQAASEHGSNYYALSYTPPNRKADGGFRKVKVSLKGKKYHLAYRSGYYAADKSAPAKPSKNLTAGLALAAMQQGSPPSRQIVFASRVVPVGKPRVVKDEPGSQSGGKRKASASGEMQRYAVDYLVIPTDLHFNPAQDGKYHDILNFMITAFDDDGRLLASQVSQMSADLSPNGLRAIQRAGVRLHQEVDIPAKGTAMRLGVEDVANSHIGTVEIPLPVKAPPEQAEAAATPSRSLPPIEPD